MQNIKFKTKFIEILYLWWISNIKVLFLLIAINKRQISKVTKPAKKCKYVPGLHSWHSVVGSHYHYGADSSTSHTFELELVRGSIYFAESGHLLAQIGWSTSVVISTKDYVAGQNRVHLLLFGSI